MWSWSSNINRCHFHRVIAARSSGVSSEGGRTTSVVVSAHLKTRNSGPGSNAEPSAVRGRREAVQALGGGEDGADAGGRGRRAPPLCRRPGPGRLRGDGETR